MINTVLVTPDGVFFLKRTDDTDKRKVVEFLSDDLFPILKDIGPDEVGLISMDGATSCLTWMRTIKRFTGYTLHYRFFIQSRSVEIRSSVVLSGSVKHRFVGCLFPADVQT